MAQRSDTLPTPLPHTLYLKCTDDQHRPAGYVGDWPEQGRCYAGQVRTHARTGRPQVHLDGFYAEKPWGAFGTHRFEVVADVWLN